MATYILPRRGVNATGYPAASLILNIADRPAVQAAIRHLVAILDVMDTRPQFVVTDAGRLALGGHDR